MTNPASPTAGSLRPGRKLLVAAGWLAVFAVLAAWLMWFRQGEAKDPGLPRVLRWGADSTGGEPYIIEERGKEPSGFEADIARYLAGKMGIESQFVAGDWNLLPDRLRRGDIEVVLNGYEWSPEREKAMASCVPYYAYRLRLIVRKDSPIADWSDLDNPDVKVGVLKDTAAHRYVKSHYPRVQVEALTTLGTTAVMDLVAKKSFEANVQDQPVVTWYMERQKLFPTLKAVGKPVVPVPHSFYVPYVKREDKTLKEAIDKALLEALKDGSLKKIYEKYGLWDADQEQLLAAASSWPPPDAAREQENWFLDLVKELGRGALWTILLACSAMPLAMLIGLVIAVGRLYGPDWLAAPLAVYVEVIRGTPVLLQLFVVYFYLPQLGIRLPAFGAGAIGLAINYAAYEAENYRAGLQAIPSGQMEAALALGMSPFTALRRIIVPQAVRLVVPPVTNDFISLFKDTSICYAIGVTELMSRNQTLMTSDPRNALAVGLVTATLYLMMSYPLSLVARRLEHRSGFRPVS